MFTQQATADALMTTSSTARARKEPGKILLKRNIFIRFGSIQLRSMTSRKSLRISLTTAEQPNALHLLYLHLINRVTDNVLGPSFYSGTVHIVVTKVG